MTSSVSAVSTQTLPCAAPDRRIVRSKLALRTAIIELMEERGLDAFTVNDLCVRADLNRGTFYNHFKDKEELLISLEDEVLSDLQVFQSEMKKLTLSEIIKSERRGEPLPFLISLFDYLRQQGDFLHAVLGPGGDIRFAPRLRDTVCAHLVKGILHRRYREHPTTFTNYYVAFFTSAYLGVIERWIETGMKEQSGEMALISMRLLFIKPGDRIDL
ncbi:MAG: TetR/AcrR family transcriptional regulator [Eggerthellaceae bacterium]|jgi:AcrR family transcriptional regulator|nr:TetR/AcrR family transcriptional regulator [Eggerthellaceae bacterium]